MTSRNLSLLVILALCLRIGVSNAGPEDAAAAEKLFRDGLDLMDAGKYAEACEAFQTAQKLDPTINTLANLANCREKNLQLATAWTLFLELERLTRDDKKQAQLNRTATKRAKGLEPRLSYMTISVSDEARIEGLVITRNGVEVEHSVWNRAIPVDGGGYVIAGRAPAHEEWQTNVTVANDSDTVTVDVPKFKEVEKLIEEDESTPAPVIVDPPPSSGNLTGMRKVAIGMAAAGVVSLVGGYVIGSRAAGLEDEARAICPTEPCTGDAARANTLLDKAETRALTGNIAVGVGVAAVAGAVVLWFLGAPESGGENAVVLAPVVSSGEVGAQVDFRF